jgi:hypothetical protein
MKQVGDLLTQNSCETERTQGDLHDWVHSVIDASAGTVDTRRRFQLRKDFLAKKFVEEIRPLSLVADHFYKGRQDVGFRPVFGSGPFDAQIVDRSSSTVEVIPLEFTQANYDEKMYQRMLFLESHGSVPLTGPVIKTGTQPSGHSVKAVLQFVNCTQERTGQFSKVAEAARRKARGARLPGTRLGIVYEGLHISKHQHFDQLYDFALQNLVPVLGGFAFLYLIRSQGDHVLQIPIAMAAP